MVIAPNVGPGLHQAINIQNKNKTHDPKDKTNADDDEPRPKISQDHYRHIHEQRDFTLENLSLAGYTDVLDYSDEKIQLEYDWQTEEDIIKINKEINAESENSQEQQPKIDYRFRIAEKTRIQDRIKNKYQYIGGIPLSMCQVENIPVIQNLNDDQMLMEYTFLADQFDWLQEQKNPK